ncbi:TVP38/TMEM64 family protein [Segetibacter aerophilus]|uniref:TVP38/TMEM64 family membrane protein n=1 Tax=Segetibacter aerophilus TaxID=670293 RepID=A0A512BJT2_9BACT|nr:VTT domain-containing protein [Segetibacter aerophilus]GEO12230.1 TVP38/TMEM64 family protein [Segetibacter aerophilus]
MKQDVIDLFSTYPQYAFLFSISINIIIAVLGVVPSVFLTAANILFFGFWNGTLISFAGESIGAAIAFWLYRKGFKKGIEKKGSTFPAVKRLLEAEGRKAFMAIISLRLIPFIPSGLITFTSAIGRVSMITFFIASSLGKIPALLIEAYAAYEVTAFNWQGKVILLLIGIYLLYMVLKKKK